MVAVGACAGDELARQDIETQIEPQQVAAPARFARAPVTGPIHTAVVPRAANPAAMTVVAVLGGPSVADLQEAAARKLTRAEKAAIEAQRSPSRRRRARRSRRRGGAVLAPSIGVTPESPRFSYTASAFDLLSADSDTFAGVARYNAFHSAVIDAEFLTLPPGDSSLFAIIVDPAELALTPARGWMVISEDNKNGPAEAELLELPAE